MRANGRNGSNGGQMGRRLAPTDATPLRGSGHEDAQDVVFDFAGLQRPDIPDLALILTARLQSQAGDRVWARALPPVTWKILHALGLDHLFHRYPTPGPFN